MNVKWISIKERLPVSDGEYIVWDKGRCTFYKKFYKKPNGFYDRMIGDAHPNRKVTHWVEGLRGPLYEMAENIMQERKAGAEEMQ